MDAKTWQDSLEELDVEELARRTLVVASYYGVETLKRFAARYPDQAAAIARSGCAISIQVTDVAAERPRVSLTVANGVGRAIEVAWVDLDRHPVQLAS